jgi:serine/threonine protein kinase
VSIFKFVKNMNAALVPLAQRNIQRLRTIRHPYVLSFLDSSVLEDSIVLVTERAIPLDIWLANMQAAMKSADSNYDEVSVRNDIMWGIQCIMTALDFLHSKCKICHNNICIQSIFVVKHGDWKINAFDYSTQVGGADDGDSSTSASGIARDYLPPERSKSDGPGSYEGDVFSFGKVISNIFATFRISVPTELDRFLKRMMSVEPKRRPAASAVMACSDLSSDFIVRLKNFGDIALKTPLETQDILQKITESASQYSKTIASFKIIVPLAQKVKMAFTDFSNRDARESSRQVGIFIRWLD